MGFVQVVKGVVGGVLVDQWKDFFIVLVGLLLMVVLFVVVLCGINVGCGLNISVLLNIIINGLKIVVFEGYGLLLFQDGVIIGFVVEFGGYEWCLDDINLQLIFVGDGFVGLLIKQSWECFKFGGQLGVQQVVFFVLFKELFDNCFGM